MELLHLWVKLCDTPPSVCVTSWIVLSHTQNPPICALSHPPSSRSANRVARHVE